MADMIRHQILPAVSKYADDLCQRAYHKDALAAALLTGDGFAVLDEASPLADYEGIHAFPTEESVSICLVTPERPPAPVERFLHYLGGQGD